MDPDLIEYNLHFIEDIYNDETNHTYEKYKIMDVIDKKISNKEYSNDILFHIVPIAYISIFNIGIFTYLYNYIINI